MSKFEELISVMKQGHKGQVKHDFLKEVFEERFHVNDWKLFQSRASYMDADKAGYAGWIVSENNPTSGPYQGTSFVWFPGEGGSVAILGIGTGGFGVDAHILARAGHKRRLQALSRLHSGRIWVKPDLLDLNQQIPKSVRDSWPEIEAAIRTYDKEGGAVMYAAVPIFENGNDNAGAVEDLLDLFFFEHGVKFKKEASDRWEQKKAAILGNVFENRDEEHLLNIVKSRRFAILQGPPGTGKTRFAKRIAASLGGSTIIQFHPSKTYEDFVIGLTPNVTSGNLAFQVKLGDLVKANLNAANGPHVLVIDEINRADLAKVLGEAVILLESGESGREVQLPHAIANGSHSLSLNDNLMIIGTLNTADRSIAKMDIAIRRRFAFIDIWPNSAVVRDQGVDIAIDSFDDVVSVFTEFVDDQGLALVPGHAYFLDPREANDAGRRDRVKGRLELELLPLLQSYVDERLLGAATNEIRSLIDRLRNRIQNNA